MLIQRSTPLDQVFREQQVVIAQKDHSIAQVGPCDELNPGLDQRLAGLVRRMSLAGHDKLHRAALVGEDPGEASGIVQQQIGPLVEGETAREPDGQDVRVEQVVDQGGRQLRRSWPDDRQNIRVERVVDRSVWRLGAGLSGQPLANVRDQLFAIPGAHRPQLGRGQPGHPLAHALHGFAPTFGAAGLGP